MKEKLMKEIQQAMNGKLSDRQKEQLVTAMRSCLQKYQISEPDGRNVFPLGDRICFFSHCLFLPIYCFLYRSMTANSRFMAAAAFSLSWEKLMRNWWTYWGPNSVPGVTITSASSRTIRMNW